MAEPVERKKGNRMRFLATGEVQLDREGREIFARLENKTKRIYKIRNGELRPWRVLLRCLKDAQDAGAPVDELDAAMRELTDAIKEILTRRRGAGTAA
jgi:hypothetical protein